MNLQSVGFILGYLIMALAVSMAVPMLVSLQYGDGQWPAFVEGMTATVFFGSTIALATRPERIRIDRRHAFLLTSLVWFILPAFGALPLWWSGLGIDLTDAVFESVSGLTTTGSTVLAGLDAMPPSLLFWRSMLQWLGGIGIIAMGIVILPFLRVGGMQIFRTESSDKSEKVVPRARQFTVLLLSVYLGLSVLCTVAYALAGMSVFEAVNHAMTTISTGGYSTSDGSMGHFASPALHWIATLFMLSGGIPFVLYIQAVRGRMRPFHTDSQVRLLVGFLAVVAIVMSLWVTAETGMPWLDAIRHSAFNVTSIVTTTGYATTDYTLWGPFALISFFFLTFVGGCSGSTSGGFKIYRFEIVGRTLAMILRRLSIPRGVFFAFYNGRRIDEPIIISVATFVILYLFTILGLAVGLSLMGLDIQTSFSGAATAVANVGPGIGPVIGPAGNFSSLPDAAKWLLSLGMILGRLEIVTVAVLLIPDFWRW